MRPCSLREAVTQSGAILHVIALVPQPPSIGGFSAEMPRMTGSRRSETAAIGDRNDYFGTFHTVAVAYTRRPPRSRFRSFLQSTTATSEVIAKLGPFKENLNKQRPQGWKARQSIPGDRWIVAGSA